ncbi:hypothetical protein TVAG_096450 [Trichomonas vaginalis G3]|uniref:Ankyrin repeat protein n=1 Tax=Trichomonas vaginalis (strain ATCC PRA-98 / G3) TaxID=412133 RepID=A2GBK2_TRIV3|nr:Ankyrin repeat family [Trichomonas vaginalis G3]EAX85464.1 hypothetical protein TVAG_096450 [Trichomonas vaginalis G3]KAI5508412.1 Ankyrin repeat family [Trichomonas vaginalis G3]|eukprot:XP_001298394.1 hypothetical protein [Trichomonas vaginalis G3]
MEKHLFILQPCINEYFRIASAHSDDINSKDDIVATILHFSAIINNGNVENAEILMAKDANFNEKDFNDVNKMDPKIKTPFCCK